MRTLTYPCRHPETRKLSKDVKAIYDGLVLIVECGRRIAAITAYHGETVLITVLDRMVVCSIKSAASELELQDGQK